MHLEFLGLIFSIVFVVALIFVFRALVRRFRYRRYVKHMHKAEDWYNKKYGSAFSDPDKKDLSNEE